MDLTEKDLPRSYGPVEAQGYFRSRPGDFVVTEEMDVPEHPTGAHWWLKITKTGINTKDAARAIARLGSARIRQIGYAGLKDRHAVTTQWFSAPIETLDPETLGGRLPEGIVLQDCKRARHAIRRGGLKANGFVIRIRDIQGDRSRLEQRLEAIAAGVPNYFGEQRFGLDGNNLRHARILFREPQVRYPRHERGLYLSAARAYLFNIVLAKRVSDRNWNRLMDGEAVLLAGSRSWFAYDANDPALQNRLETHDIHPSGPLVGTGEPAVDGACAALERSVLDQEPGLVAGLIELNMRAERRALRVVPEALHHQWEDGDLHLRFSLPSGCFATTILRELMALESAA